eukprot:s4010_g4.t1
MTLEQGQLQTPPACRVQLSPNQSASIDLRRIEDGERTSTLSIRVGRVKSYATPGARRAEKKVWLLVVSAVKISRSVESVVDHHHTFGEHM